mgnify:FL=1
MTNPLLVSTFFKFPDEAQSSKITQKGLISQTLRAKRPMIIFENKTFEFLLRPKSTLRPKGKVWAVLGHFGSETEIFQKSFKKRIRNSFASVQKSLEFF